MQALHFMIIKCYSFNFKCEFCFTKIKIQVIKYKQLFENHYVHQTHCNYQRNSTQLLNSFLFAFVPSIVFRINTGKAIYFSSPTDLNTLLFNPNTFLVALKYFKQILSVLVTSVAIQRLPHYENIVFLMNTESYTTFIAFLK